MNRLSSRLSVPVAFFIFYMIVVVCKLGYVTIDKSYASFQQRATSDVHKHNILDRNGIILAQNGKRYDFYIHANSEKIDSDILRKISSVMPFPADKVLQALKRRDHGIVLVKKGVTGEQKDKLYQNGVSTAYFETSVIREYPYNNLFSHIVGYSSIDNIGQIGLEKSYNSQLRQNNVKTTLDIQFQSILRTKLLNKLDYFDAKSAFGIIVEAQTGNVVASVSLPDFNPNETIPNTEVMINTVLNTSYELGSVMKFFSVGLALENGFKPEDVINVTDKIYLNSRKSITDDHSHDDDITLDQVFYRSSNIGAARLVQEVGSDKYIDMLKRMEIISNSYDTADISEAEMSLSGVPKIWREANKLTAAYGYGLSMSPLHFVSSLLPFANGGRHLGLSFVDRQYKTQSPKVGYVLEPKVASQMLQIANKVTTIGTGKMANVGHGIDVCGKTGTAEMFDSKLKRYTSEHKITSFVSIFPCMKPKYVMYVGFVSPKYTDAMKADGFYNVIQGGTVAAPVSGDIISSIASIDYQNLYPKSHPQT